MAEIRFPAYRNYEASRIEANNAMMALLAGSRLAANTLLLTEGSHALLPTMFPRVPHIRRFNLTTEAARQLLLDADSHLGAVAVPYALAVHEDFIMTAISMLKDAGIPIQSQKKAVKAWNMHEAFFRTCGTSSQSPAIEHFHLLRCMRNAQIHEAGKVTKDLADLITHLSATAVTAWQHLTGRVPGDVVATGRVVFGASDIFAAFAVTKELGRQANAALGSSLPRAEWAEVAVRDFTAATSRTRNSDQWMRGLRGYARDNYKPLQLTDSELDAAARSCGAWSRP